MSCLGTTICTLLLLPKKGLVQELAWSTLRTLDDAMMHGRRHDALSKGHSVYTTVCSVPVSAGTPPAVPLAPGFMVGRPRVAWAEGLAMG